MFMVIKEHVAVQHCGSLVCLNRFGATMELYGSQEEDTSQTEFVSSISPLLF